MTSLQNTRIAAGQDLPLLNAPSDAPTLFADGLAAAMTDDAVVRISLYEQVAGQDQQPKGRYIANLVLSRSGFKAFYEAITTIGKDLFPEQPSDLK